MVEQVGKVIKGPTGECIWILLFNMGINFTKPGNSLAMLINQAKKWNGLFGII